MGSKHLKKPNTPDRNAAEKMEKHSTSSKKQPKKSDVLPAGDTAPLKPKTKQQAPPKAADNTANGIVPGTGAASHLREVPLPDKAESKAKKEKVPKPKKESATPPPKKKNKHVKPPASAEDFRQEKTTEEKRSRRQQVQRTTGYIGALIAFLITVILFLAAGVIYFYQASLSTDDLILSTVTAAVPEDEYVFDAGSGQAFSAAGQGLAVANSTGFELLDSTGAVVTSKLLQMDNPAVAACDSYAIFYDLGGTNIAAADFQGNITELSVAGDILSVTISSGGYAAVTTECTGYRALVTVYNAELTPVYEWYSSSAWVISAAVAPDGQSVAVLSYTASGSEVRFFRLDQTAQTGAFAISDKILLDIHWFSSDRLCAYTTDQVLFFNAAGRWLDTYSFAGQYLTGFAGGGDGFITLSLSPYRTGTTSVLVSLDESGKELGTADIESEIISLTASGDQVLALYADGVILYSGSLAEKGRLTGLPGFKYALLRAKGEALLIASNYAEVYKF